jgi:hypothetical protein
MANGLGYRRALAAAGLALGCAVGCAASAPAQAQFMSSPYPVIFVPPPPEQSMVMPKPSHRTLEPASPPEALSLPDASVDQSKCHHGRTNVCR